MFKKLQQQILQQFCRTQYEKIYMVYGIHTYILQVSLCLRFNPEQRVTSWNMGVAILICTAKSIYN